MKDLSNLNVSALFSNLGNNNNNMGINLSDYASIKNGSYGKLMKAYYSKDSDNENVWKVSEEKTKKPSLDDKDAKVLSQTKTTADELKASATALTNKDLFEKDTDGNLDYEKISAALKDFTDDYNKVIDQTSKVNAKGVGDSTKWMTSLSGVMSNTLSKVGISVGLDNKLSFNEDTLKKASEGTLKSLFTDKNSFASQIADKANSISTAALSANSLYTNEAKFTNPVSGLFDDLA